VTTPSFLVRESSALGKPVHRLGLATTHGLDERGIRSALERGLNYIFWNPTARALTRVLRDVAKRDRDRLVISTGPTLGYFPGSVRRRAERALRLLGVDYLDVLQLYWLGWMSSFSGAVAAEMVKLKEEGKVRVLGASIHDRVRAGRLALDSPLSMLMIRYNAAHPGAEQDVFPHLAVRLPAVVAYTATRWGRLLRAPRGWTGRVPSAGDCYRFCLSSRHVDVTLCSPANAGQLEENLRALDQGPLGGEEMDWMRAFGRAVHG
jgi:aryl-alcohol dehydrogenase-like predicted oxidoreductase